MKPFIAALSMLFAVVFLMLMVAMTATYPVLNTIVNWQIFGVVDMMIVIGGLAAAIK
jgi:hypothetical protein